MKLLVLVACVALAGAANTAPPTVAPECTEPGLQCCGGVIGGSIADPIYTCTGNTATAADRNGKCCASQDTCCSPVTGPAGPGNSENSNWLCCPNNATHTSTCTSDPVSGLFGCVTVLSGTVAPSTSSPTTAPTKAPTVPTVAPSVSPTGSPSVAPTGTPTSALPCRGGAKSTDLSGNTLQCPCPWGTHCEAFDVKSPACCTNDLVGQKQCGEYETCSTCGENAGCSWDAHLGCIEDIWCQDANSACSAAGTCLRTLTGTCYERCSRPGWGRPVTKAANPNFGASNPATECSCQEHKCETDGTCCGDFGFFCLV